MLRIKVLQPEECVAGNYYLVIALTKSPEEIEQHKRHDKPGVLQSNANGQWEDIPIVMVLE